MILTLPPSRLPPGSLPEAMFASVDTDGGGSVAFDEFAHWALQIGLELEAEGGSSEALDNDLDDAAAGGGPQATYALAADAGGEAVAPGELRAEAALTQEEWQVRSGEVGRANERMNE